MKTEIITLYRAEIHTERVVFISHLHGGTNKKPNSNDKGVRYYYSTDLPCLFLYVCTNDRD